MNPSLLPPLLFLTLLSCTPDLAPAAAPESNANTPNVLLIVADDLGWADLNCYGSHLIESPNIDKLASNGLQFMQGYAAAPVCSPSRASIQTGLYPTRIGLTEHIHGFYDNPDWKLIPPVIPAGLDLQYTTLGEVAKGAGYKTAHVGKWHLGDEEHHPSKQGYDETYAGGREGLPQSFYHPFFAGEPFPELMADTRPGDYLTDALGNKALDLIEKWEGEPWLISLNFYAPHVPIEGRKDWVEYYENLIADTHERPFPTIEYAAMVSTLDENVGRIVKHLEATGQLDNTLIIFVSDNGGLHVREIPAFAKHTPPTDNGILRAGKGYLYEGGIRIPFILHYRGAIQLRKATLEPVITNDIMPTIAEAIGRPRAYNSPDGSSLMPLLKGESLPRRQLFWHFPHYSPQGGTPAAAVRSGDFKMYVDYEKDSTAYYNVIARPDEGLMLAGAPDGNIMSKSLVEWKASVRAKDASIR